jgi:hypothetical protein
LERRSDVHAQLQRIVERARKAGIPEGEAKTIELPSADRIGR